MIMPYLMNMAYLLGVDWLMIVFPSVVEPCGLTSVADITKMYLASYDNTYKSFL